MTFLPAGQPTLWVFVELELKLDRAKTISRPLTPGSPWTPSAFHVSRCSLAVQLFVSASRMRSDDIDHPHRSVQAERIEA